MGRFRISQPISVKIDATKNNIVTPTMQNVVVQKPSSSWSYPDMHGHFDNVVLKLVTLCVCFETYLYAFARESYYF